MRVSPGRLTLAAACCAAVVTMPAAIARATSTGATLSIGVSSPTAAKSPTVVHLTADPVRPAAGAPVTLSVSDPSAGAAGFAWDLTGSGAFSHHTPGPHTAVAFATPGTHAVAVRVEHAGRTLLGRLTVSVVPRPRVTAHTAGDPGVTIADFHFSPATTTIHVGDTITWSNSGPSSHTATASNGSFNTGILKKGQSASHTFTQAGTFAYVCQIHPFMHGSVIVQAATTSTTTSPTSSASAATTATATTATATTAAAQTGPTLPNTGFNVLAGLGAGLVLLGVGASLRRTRPR